MEAPSRPRTLSCTTIIVNIHANNNSNNNKLLKQSTNVTVLLPISPGYTVFVTTSALAGGTVQMYNSNNM